MKRNIYALYIDNKKIDEGTAEEIALRQGMSADRIKYYYYSPNHKKNIKVIRLKKIDVVEPQYCARCHKKTKRHPTRLVRFEYKYYRYSQYNEVDFWILCDSCFRVFKNWLDKGVQK